MSNVKTGPEAIADSDTRLGADARNAQDRRAALIWCLNNDWIGARIGRLERVDNTRFHGWKMWEWKTQDA